MSALALEITPSALAAVQKIIQERQIADHALRVYVQESGCCSSRQYGLALDPNLHTEDIVLEKEGLRIIVDPRSSEYLQDAVIDFVDGPQGRGFIIEAASHCGCGGGGHTHAHNDEGCGCGGNHEGSGCGCGH